MEEISHYENYWTKYPLLSLCITSAKRSWQNWQTSTRSPSQPTRMIHAFHRSSIWIYQAGRYVKKGLAAGVKLDDVMRNMDESKKRNLLMEQLGVKQQSLRDRNGQKDG